MLLSYWQSRGEKEILFSDGEPVASAADGVFELPV